jgi:hypothetical protein
MSAPRAPALALALTLAVTPVPALAAAPAAAPTERVVRAGLVIDTSALGAAAEGVKERIRVRGEAQLREGDVLPARSDEDPRVTIAVEPLGAEPGYRCTFAVREGDEVVAGTEGTSLCQLCTEDELVDHVDAAIERVVPQIPASTSSTPAPVTTPVLPPAERTPELRALGKAGLALSISGSVLVGVGSGLAARQNPDDDEGLPAGFIGGLALVSISVPLLVAGLAMVAVDMRRGAAERNAATHAKVSRRRAAWRLAPSAGRTSAGVVVHGRF